MLETTGVLTLLIDSVQLCSKCSRNIFFPSVGTSSVDRVGPVNSPVFVIRLLHVTKFYRVLVIYCEFFIIVTSRPSIRRMDRSESSFDNASGHASVTIKEFIDRNFTIALHHPLYIFTLVPGKLFLYPKFK